MKIVITKLWMVPSLFAKPVKPIQMPIKLAQMTANLAIKSSFITFTCFQTQISMNLAIVTMNTMKGAKLKTMVFDTKLYV